MFDCKKDVVVGNTADVCFSSGEIATKLAKRKTTGMPGMLLVDQSRGVRPRAEREWWSEKHTMSEKHTNVGNTQMLATHKC